MTFFTEPSEAKRCSQNRPYFHPIVIERAKEVMGIVANWGTEVYAKFFPAPPRDSRPLTKEDKEHSGFALIFVFGTRAWYLKKQAAR